MSGTNEEYTPEVVGGKSVTDLIPAGSQSITEMQAKMERMGAMLDLKKKFLRDNLKEGIQNDYAVIPGCGDKKVMLKPGAEKLLDWHGYYPTFQVVAEKEDYSLGIFSYTYRCTIKQRGTNVVIADCEGDASTMESKYRFEWRFANQLAPGTSTEHLKTKEVGKNKVVMYQVVVDNPADKRNTVRKMAQKRALLGATVLATATSDLFTTEVEPEDDDKAGHGGEPEQAQKPKAAPKKDYGNPISEPQRKRLYAIRKGAEIKEPEFNAWLKATYGWEHDTEIGWKAYDEICKAVEKGRLEMPEPEEKPKDATPPAGLDALIAEIDDLEGQIGGNPSANRQAKTGATDLSTRTETQLRNYLEWLKGQVKA